MPKQKEAAPDKKREKDKKRQKASTRRVPSPRSAVLPGRARKFVPDLFPVRDFPLLVSLLVLLLLRAPRIPPLCFDGHCGTSLWRPSYMAIAARP